MKKLFLILMGKMGFFDRKTVFGSMGEAYKEGFRQGVEAGLKLSGMGNVSFTQIVDLLKPQNKVH